MVVADHHTEQEISHDREKSIGVIYVRFCAKRVSAFSSRVLNKGTQVAMFLPFIYKIHYLQNILDVLNFRRLFSAV